MTWTTRPTFLVAAPVGFFSVAIAVAIRVPVCDGLSLFGGTPPLHSYSDPGGQADGLAAMLPPYRQLPPYR